MLLLLDNYDSFTYNLVHYLGELGVETIVRRNDALSVKDCLALEPSSILISPGPCTPDKAGISLDLVGAAAEHQIPLLGVCLGHQAIGQYFGGKITHAPAPMHGKVSDIHHHQQDVFDKLPSPFQATRYHSLIIDPATIPDCLEITARTPDDIIMGIRHHTLPLFGVQFHPESIASEHGHKLLSNFLKQC